MDESQKRSARLSMPNLCPGIGAAVGGNNVEQHSFCNRRNAGAAEPPCARLQATACTHAQPFERRARDRRRLPLPLVQDPKRQPGLGCPAGDKPEASRVLEGPQPDAPFHEMPTLAH
jgi:hypothetical protein